VLEVHGERMLKRDFVAGGRARTHHKDLQIILDLAKESGTRLPFAEKVDEMFVQLIERGLGDEDHSALVKLLES